MGKSSNKYKILCEVSIKEIGFGKNYLEKESLFDINLDVFYSVCSSPNLGKSSFVQTSESLVFLPTM